MAKPSYGVAFREMGVELPAETIAWLDGFKEGTRLKDADGYLSPEGLTLLPPSNEGFDVRSAPDLGDFESETVGVIAASFRLMVEDGYVGQTTPDTPLVPSEYVPFATMAEEYYFIGVNGERRGLVYSADVAGQGRSYLASHDDFTLVGRPADITE